MDFRSQLAGISSGRRFKCLTIVDDFTREVLALKVDSSIPELWVIRVLDQLKATTGLPRFIRADNVRSGVQQQSFRRIGVAERREA